MIERVLFWLSTALLVLALASPFQAVVPSFDNDVSYQYLLNYLADSRFQFGAAQSEVVQSGVTPSEAMPSVAAPFVATQFGVDFIFSYGPLSWLSSRVYADSLHLFRAKVLFHFAVAAVCAFCIIQFRLRARRRSFSWLALSGLYISALVADPIVFFPDALFATLLLWLVFFCSDPQRNRIGALVVLAALAPVLALTKGLWLVAAVVCSVAVMLGLLRRARQTALLAIYSVVFLCSGYIAYVHFAQQQLINLPKFIVAMAEVLRAYPLAMSTESGLVRLPTAAALFAAFIAGVFVVWWRSRRNEWRHEATLPTIIILFFCAAVGFQHSIVRGGPLLEIILAASSPLLLFLTMPNTVPASTVPAKTVLAKTVPPNTMPNAAATKTKPAHRAQHPDGRPLHARVPSLLPLLVILLQLHALSSVASVNAATGAASGAATGAVRHLVSHARYSSALLTGTLSLSAEFADLRHRSQQLRESLQFPRLEALLDRARSEEHTPASLGVFGEFEGLAVVKQWNLSIPYIQFYPLISTPALDQKVRAAFLQTPPDVLLVAFTQRPEHAPMLNGGGLLRLILANYQFEFSEAGGPNETYGTSEDGTSEMDGTSETGVTTEDGFDVYSLKAEADLTDAHSATTDSCDWQPLTLNQRVKLHGGDSKRVAVGTTVAIKAEHSWWQKLVSLLLPLSNVNLTFSDRAGDSATYVLNTALSHQPFVVSPLFATHHQLRKFMRGELLPEVGELAVSRRSLLLPLPRLEICVISPVE